MNVSTVRVCPHCDSLVDVTDGGPQPTCPECGRAWSLSGAAVAGMAAGAVVVPSDIRGGLETLDRLWDEERARHRTSTITYGYGRRPFGKTVRVWPSRLMGIAGLAAGVILASRPWGNEGLLTRWLPPPMTWALLLATGVAAARHEIDGAVAFEAARRSYAAARAKVEAGRHLVSGDWGHDADQPTPPARLRRNRLWLAIYLAAAFLSAGIILRDADRFPYDRKLGGAVIDMRAVGIRPIAVAPDRLQTVAEIWTWAGAAATAVLVAAAMRVPREV